MDRSIASARSNFHRRGVLGILTLTYVVSLVDRNILAVLATPVKADLDISDGQLGLLGGLAFVLLYSVMGIPLARLADSVGRAPVIAASVALWSVFTMACGASQSFAQLFTMRMGVGIGEAGGTAPSYSLINDHFPAGSRSRALAIYSLGAPIGVAAGMLGGGWLAGIVHWRWVFVIVGAFGLVLAPLLMFWVPVDLRGTRPERVGAGLRASGKVIAQLARKPSFWLLAVGVGFANIPSAGLLFWLPSYFQRSFGLSVREASLYCGSIMLVGGVLGALAGGHLSDLLDRRGKAAYALVPATAFLLAPPTLLVAMNTTLLSQAWGLFALWQALTFVFVGPVVAAINSIAAPGTRSTASASFLLVQHLLGAGFGTFLLGFVSDLLRDSYGTEALRYSILFSLPAYLIAACLHGLAASRLRRDWFAPADDLQIKELSA